MSELLELYRPNERIIENNRLAPFVGIADQLVIIGSGSPRNSRISAILPSSLSAVQLSAKRIRELRDQGVSPEYNMLLDIILHFKEPKRQWQIDAISQEVNDNHLATNKARLALASALILGNNQSLNNIMVLGRDFNVADQNGFFMDKPGYLYPYEALHIQMPDAWVQDGTGPAPIEPVEQYERLYRNKVSDTDPRPFYIANSTSLLTTSLNFGLPNIEDLVNLVNLKKILPDWVSSTEVISYMALRPTKEVTEFAEELIRYYSALFLPRTEDKYGRLLYTIPGIVDWSRLTQFIEIWVSDRTLQKNSPIQTSFKSLKSSVDQGNGQWLPFHKVAKFCPDISNELVGISTYALDKVFDNKARLVWHELERTLGLFLIALFK